MNFVAATAVICGTRSVEVSVGFRSGSFPSAIEERSRAAAIKHRGVRGEAELAPELLLDLGFAPRRLALLRELGQPAVLLALVLGEHLAADLGFGRMVALEIEAPIL